MFLVKFFLAYENVAAFASAADNDGDGDGIATPPVASATQNNNHRTVFKKYDTYCTYLPTYQTTNIPAVKTGSKSNIRSSEKSYPAETQSRDKIDTPSRRVQFNSIKVKLTAVQPP